MKSKEKKDDRTPKTSMMIVPVLDDMDMTKLRKAIKGFYKDEVLEAGAKGGKPRCVAEGKPCDFIGISWCNGQMPAPKIDMAFSIEYAIR